LKEVNTIFVRCALGVVVDRLVDVYMHIKDKKKLWDELNDKVVASDVDIFLVTKKKYTFFNLFSRGEHLTTVDDTFVISLTVKTINKVSFRKEMCKVVMIFEQITWFHLYISFIWLYIQDGENTWLWAHNHQSL